jgi:hypothetical protein
MTDPGYPVSPQNEKYVKNPYFDIVPIGNKKGGRSTIVLNDVGLDAVRKLASMGATKTEIIAFLGSNYDVLHNKVNAAKFTETIESASEVAKLRIRQAQYKCLDNGNSAVTIFMSKAVLGMTDGQQAPQANNMFTDFLQEARKYAEIDKEDEDVS